MKAILPLLLLAAAPAFADPTGPSVGAAADCPLVGEQLSEALASAKQRVGRDGEVRVEFDVDARGRARLVHVNGTRAYRTPVRIAMDALDCRAGTPQRYVLNIRFAEPMSAAAMAAAASATLAQASPR